MVTLKEAIKLADIQEDELVYLKQEGSSKFDRELMTLREIRNKLDMKNLKVVSIKPSFSFDGEFQGMEFVLKGGK